MVQLVPVELRMSTEPEITQSHSKWKLNRIFQPTMTTAKAREKALKIILEFIF